MIVIIHARRFDLQEELRSFIGNCLQILPTGDERIKSLKLSLGEEENSVTQIKYCTIRADVSGTDYLVTQHAASFEEAVVKSVQELNMKLREQVHPLRRPTDEKSQPGC